MRRPRRRAKRQPDWWADHRNLAALFEWLSERAEAPDPSYFMEKPWKWNGDWTVYQRWLSGERCPAEDCPYLEDECPVHKELYANTEA